MLLVEDSNMTFRWKKLRCLLPFVIIFIICWLAYWMVFMSSAPVIDLAKIQNHEIAVPQDKSVGLKFVQDEIAPSRLGDINEKQSQKPDDFYSEVDLEKKLDKAIDEKTKDSTKWEDEIKFDYSESEEESKNYESEQKPNAKMEPFTKERESQNEYVVFNPDEESDIGAKIITHNIVKGISEEMIPKELLVTDAQDPQKDNFVEEPIWRNVMDAKNSNKRKKNQDAKPATPFPDAIPMPQKKSNILLSISPPVKSTLKPIQDPLGRYRLGANPKKSSLSESFYVIMHGGKASLVHTEIHSNHLLPMSGEVAEEAYVFTSKHLPSEPRLRPSIGNGRLATVVHTPEVFVSGLYNGRLSESHRAAVPSTVSFNITETVPQTNFSRYYSLNVGTGIYSERSVSQGYNLTYQVYAHRNLSNLMVVEVDLVRSDIHNPLTLKVNLSRWKSSYDLTFRTMETHRYEVSYKVGILKAIETADSPDIELHIIYDHVPKELTPSPKTRRTKWIFLTSYGYTKQEAELTYDTGLSQIHGQDGIYASHVRAWSRLWSRGRIDVKGNLTVARATYASWYYILSSLPLQPDKHFSGLSPCGLPLGDKDKDYQGHVMWDQELWMFPPVLLFHPNLATMMIGARNRLSSGAVLNAKQAKSAGLIFPWESGQSGVELSSEGKRGFVSPFVTAGVAFAVRQLLSATQASSAIQRQFGHLITEIGHFLVSSKLDCKDNKCSVNDVLPPDGSHGHISNSPFVNEIIRNALLLLSDLNSLQNSTADHWRSFASDIVLPYDETAQLHPAFDFYKKDSVVFEADAVLLGYPLLRSMTKNLRISDLNFYESVLDPRTSPMTWAMHTIGWLEVGNHERASAAFEKQFLFVRNNFQVWSNRTLGAQNVAFNYLSGMGTFLQSLINGYGGIRLHSSRLDLDPSLPDGVTEMHFIGVDYLGSSINIYIYPDEVMLVMTSSVKRTNPLTLYIYEPEEVHSLRIQEKVRFHRRKATILPAGEPIPTLSPHQ